MKDIESLLSKTVAKKMMNEGESWKKIIETTHLNLNELKRIQREDRDSHF